ncbi:MAG: peroxidase [Hyphomicrobiales bacterium]|nr:peroxidase [Hyphomicrobiales bacterium]
MGRRSNNHFGAKSGHSGRQEYSRYADDEGSGQTHGWAHWTPHSGQTGLHKWWPFAHHKGGHHHHHKHHKHHKPADDPQPSEYLDEAQAEALLDLDARNSDGTENNPINAGLGAAGSQLLRVSDAHYQDGAGTPYSGANPRGVSNVILDQDVSMPSSFGVSDLFTYFGQFIDHDIDLTPEGHSETIAFSHADGDFGISRSAAVPGTGTDASNPLEFPNVITSFVDASNIYGSHDDVTSVLRADGGTSPYLLTSDDDYAPTLEQIQQDYPGLDPNNVGGGPLTVGGPNPELFVAGDVRANENIALTSMHTVWIREHNYQVDRFKELMPDATNEELFKVAKLVVEAEYQNVVFNEYLPLLLGEENIPAYQGYDENVNPNVAIEFSTAAYRLGHSQISPTIARRDEDGSESTEGDLGLFQAFFQPDQLLAGGIDSVIRGLGAQTGQEIDENIVDDVRNLLFGGTQASPIDLGVFNILRGYDHGIPSLNEVRIAYGLAPLTSFAALTSDPAVAAQFAQVYGSIDQVDLWVGGLAETKVPGSQLGETFHTIVLDQFMRFRDGDSFFFEERLQDHPELLEMIKDSSLSDIILRTTDIDYFQDDAFIAHNRIGGTDWKDVLVGTDDHDLIIGFDGHDKLFGRRGDDDLYGGDGNDRAYGGRGDDIIDGEDGNDRLYGGRGNDILTGGGGRDTMYGGRGDDLFVLTDFDARDFIADYGTGDQIDLTALFDVPDSDTTDGLSQGDVDAVVHYAWGRLSVENPADGGLEQVAQIRADGGGRPESIVIVVDDGAGYEATFTV